MNNFTLDDMEDLVITSSRLRLDNTGEYDISYYENYVNENIEIIGELINNVQNQIELIKDDSIKKIILLWSKDLARAYEKNQNKQPRQEYENSPYSKSHGAGYLQTHKYSEFIGRDLIRLTQSYSNVINFMHNVYKNATVSERKGEIDNRQLYNIFFTTKKACSNLGIHCPPAQVLYDSITGDPYEEKSELLSMDFEIEEDNSLEHDIIITSLPYTVTVPIFTYKGCDKMENPVTNPTPKVWYNQSYLDKKPPVR